MNAQATAAAGAASPPTDDPTAGSPGRWSTSPRRLVLIAMVTVALVGTPAAAAAWWLSSDADAATEEPREGDLLTLEPMTVGLSGGAGHARVGVGLVLAEGADPQDLEPRLPLMKDAALERIAGMGPSELSSPEGMGRLRDELARDAADIFAANGEPVVLRAFLTELVVQ